MDREFQMPSPSLPPSQTSWWTVNRMNKLNLSHNKLTVLSHKPDEPKEAAKAEGRRTGLPYVLPSPLLPLFPHPPLFPPPQHAITHSPPPPSLLPLPPLPSSLPPSAEVSCLSGRRSQLHPLTRHLSPQTASLASCRLTSGPRACSLSTCTATS